MPYIQINSTATNLWATLISVSVGFVLAQVANLLKAHFDKKKIVQQAAAAIRAEVETNIRLTHAWDRNFQADVNVGTSDPANVVSVGTVPFQTLALENACTTAVFDGDLPELGIEARDLLLKLRAANLLIDFRSQREFVNPKPATAKVREERNAIHRLQVGHLYADLHTFHASLNEAAKTKVLAPTKAKVWPGLRDETDTVDVFGIKPPVVSPAE